MVGQEATTGLQGLGQPGIVLLLQRLTRRPAQVGHETQFQGQVIVGQASPFRLVVRHDLPLQVEASHPLCLLAHQPG